MIKNLWKKQTETMSNIEKDNPCNHCLYATDYYGHCLQCKFNK